jgi:hypothetical protein
MSSRARKKTYLAEITRQLNVKAPDDKLLPLAETFLREFETATESEKEEVAIELQRIEGILWERHRQLKFWISTLIRKRGSPNETAEYIERKKQCLTTINKIRKIRKKRLYGGANVH